MLALSMIYHVVHPNLQESDKAAPRDAKTLITGIVALVVSVTVLVIFLITKFMQGAFAIVIIMPVLIMVMRRIRLSYGPARTRPGP